LPYHNNPFSEERAPAAHSIVRVCNQLREKMHQKRMIATGAGDIIVVYFGGKVTD